MSTAITISGDGSTITVAEESSHSSLTGRSDADQHPQSAITDLVADLAAKQPLDADLTAIAALTTTAYGRGVLPLADAPALASYAGVPLLATTGITGTLTLTKTGTTARTVTFPDAAITVAGSASALTSGLIPQAGVGGILADSALGTSSITGTLTITKTGTTARTVTFPDAALTVARTDAAQTFTGLQSFDALTASGQIGSTLATGTAPISVASTTVCPNLNASFLGGATFAAPGAIGGTTPAAGSFTTATLTGALSVTTAGSVATLNGTSGAYATWQHNGTSTGDVGIANQLVSGATTDFAISSRSVGNLVLGAGEVTQVTISNAAPGTPDATKILMGAGVIKAGAGISCATLTATGVITSTVSTGTAPFTVASTTVVANLNASSLGGATFAAPGAIGGGTPGAGAFTTLSATGAITSTLATGSAPLVIASTTKVANLNVDFLNGTTWAAPGAIGGTTPAAGSFTTATLTGALSVTTSGSVATLNGTSGAYATWQHNGTSTGDVGIANQVVGGATTDFAISSRSVGNLVLGASEVAQVTISAAAPGTPGATSILMGAGVIKAGAGISCTTLTASSYFGCNGATAVAPVTGYGTPTNGALQSSFDASSITLGNLAAAVAKLIVDLKATGLIGA